MSVFQDLFGNFFLISVISAWLIAQLIKVFTGMFRERSFSVVTLLFSTGGMPSSHTASVIALMTAAALHYGLGSFAFAASFLLAMVVMIDATGVRRETGEQAKILNRMMVQLFEAKNSEEWNRTLKELVGHTPLQVLAGAGVGLIVPISLYLTPWFA